MAIQEQRTYINPPAPKPNEKDPFPWGKSPDGWKAGAGGGSCQPGADIPKPDSREKPVLPGNAQ